jgi:PAS domain S-box-containing protein
MKAIMNVASGLYSLKKVLKTDVGHFEKDILYRVGAEAARLYLDRRATDTAPKEPKDALLRFLRSMASDGIGAFEILRFDHERRLVELSASATIEAIGFKEYGDVQKDVSCSYTAGFIAAICRRIFASQPDGASDIEALEVECAAGGSTCCRFLAGPKKELEALGHRIPTASESISEHALKLNEEILESNLKLQNANLSLERQVIKRGEDLRKAEEKFRSMVNLSPDAVMILGHDGRVSLINETGLRMLAYQRVEDVEGKIISSLLTDGTTAWDKLAWALEKENIVRNVEVRFVRMDGTEFVGEVSARFTENHVERLIQMIVRDVTERNEHLEDLREARQESGFFNTLLSHDIVNHLSAAMHFTENLRKSPHLSEDDRKNLDVVHKNIKGAFELAAVVRDTAKARTLGEGDCEMKDVGHVLTEAIEDSKHMHSDRKVRINFTEPTDRCYARGNVLLSRLFSNILTNSIKFDPHQEVVVDVTVDAVHDSGTAYWRVTISDRGKGIPDEDKKRVFDRYYRRDTSMPGTGLGLFLAAHLINVCRGKIWAENRVEGDPSQGTVMVMLLEKAVQSW